MIAVLGLLLASAPVARAQAPAAASETVAPRPFTPEQIRLAMPAGTRISMRVEVDGQKPTIERWTVVEATEATCTIASSVYDAATGALLKDEGARTSAWPELADHASFPAGDTEVSDGSFTGDIGTHAVREYRVRRADGSVHVFRFAVDLPGPPAEMIIEREGRVAFRMTQILRQPG
jgi:hypothetical protein